MAEYLYRGEKAYHQIYLRHTKAELYAVMIDLITEFLGEDVAYNNPELVKDEIKKRINILKANNLIILHHYELGE